MTKSPLLPLTQDGSVLPALTCDQGYEGLSTQHVCHKPNSYITDLFPGVASVCLFCLYHPWSPNSPMESECLTDHFQDVGTGNSAYWLAKGTVYQ